MGKEEVEIAKIITHAVGEELGWDKAFVVAVICLAVICIVDLLRRWRQKRREAVAQARVRAKTMPFGKAVGSFLKNYLTFRGRASRSAYWWALLFIWIVAIFAGIAAAILIRSEEFVVPLLIGVLAQFSLLSLTARRLHDLNASGWWAVLIVVPIVATVANIAFWVCFLFRGTAGDNRFGADPLLQQT